MIRCSMHIHRSQHTNNNIVCVWEGHHGITWLLVVYRIIEFANVCSSATRILPNSFPDLATSRFQIAAFPHSRRQAGYLPSSQHITATDSSVPNFRLNTVYLVTLKNCNIDFVKKTKGILKEQNNSSSRTANRERLEKTKQNQIDTQENNASEQI